MPRTFGHYEAIVRAGPQFPDVTIEIEYFDTHGEVIGTYGCSTIAFATTWKDVATIIRTGMRMHQIDTDPMTNVSPMVDLS